ncbi:MAG: hypothetical protein P8170_21665 [Gemmatimonadota bacterium]|jgi:hypothetical protein
MIKRLIGTVLMTAVLHGTVAAQETSRDRAQEVLPPDVFRQIEALALETRGEGIPDEILFNKALEGMAKRVPPDQVVPAVRAYAGRLRQVRTAFGPTSTPPLLVAGADALQRGVGADALRRLREGEGAVPSPMAILVLADLVESGVPADRAVALVREALQRRTREEEILGIPERVRRLMRQGRTAQDAAEQVRRTLRRRGGGVGLPVPPGSEPLTAERRRRLQRSGGEV